MLKCKLNFSYNITKLIALIGSGVGQDASLAEWIDSRG